MTIEDAIKALRIVLDFIMEEGEYKEFEDDLYSLLDAFTDDKNKAKTKGGIR